MPERAIVINTTALIALAAATGSLDVLRTLYDRVIVPFEVESELLAAGSNGFGIDEFSRAGQWLHRRASAVKISEYLRRTLDSGEAAVIQTALNERIDLVCIDENSRTSSCASERFDAYRFNRRPDQSEAGWLRGFSRWRNRSHAPEWNMAWRGGGAVCIDFRQLIAGPDSRPVRKHRCAGMLGT